MGGVNIATYVCVCARVRACVRLSGKWSGGGNS